MLSREFFLGMLASGAQLRRGEALEAVGIKTVCPSTAARVSACGNSGWLSARGPMLAEVGPSGDGWATSSVVCTRFRAE